MSKINFLDIYRERIKQIEIDSKKAVREKNWSELAKLNAEKERLQSYIDKG